MTESYWNQESDHYQYPNSPILKNLPGIHDAHALERFEQRTTMLRLDEVTSAIADAPINLETWQTIHRILFQDIYDWAGNIRTVQLAKGKTVFAMPNHITKEAARIFSALANEALSTLDHSQLAEKIAYYFGELNVLHPFREGNGRTQKLLFDEIVRHANYCIAWERMDTDDLLQALILPFHTQEYNPLNRLFQTALIESQ